MTNTTTYDHLIGSRSHGDLRLQAILATAADTADEFMLLTTSDRRVVDFYLEIIEIGGGILDADVSDNITEFAFEIADRIDWALPPGLYFGNLEGDASDIGVWPYLDFKSGLEDD